MSYLLIFSIITFITYVTIITLKYGFLSSISESFYRIPSKYQFLFTLFCWGFSFPLMIVGLEQTNNVLMFLSPSGIMFVGAAAAFKGNKLTHDVHMTCATIGVVFSHLAIWFVYQQYLIGLISFIIMLTLIILTWLKINVKYFFWIEIIAYISITTCVVLFEIFT